MNSRRMVLFHQDFCTIETNEWIKTRIEPIFSVCFASWFCDWKQLNKYWTVIESKHSIGVTSHSMNLYVHSNFLFDCNLIKALLNVQTINMYQFLMFTQKPVGIKFQSIAHSGNVWDIIHTMINSCRWNLSLFIFVSVSCRQ